MTKIVPSLEFETLIAAKQPVLIDVFGAECQPCVWISPAIDALAEDLSGQALVVKMDRDEAFRNGGDNNTLLAFMANQDLRGIPALLLFEDGAYKDALIGGPLSKGSIRDWMETTLSRKFNTAAAPASDVSVPFRERYGLVVENLPSDPDERASLPSAVIAVLAPYFATDEVEQVGIGSITDDDSKNGVTFISSRRAAEAVANAFPSECVLDRAGDRIENTILKAAPKSDPKP